MNNIGEILYGILFHPVETFRNADYSKPYKLPLCIILFVALFWTMMSSMTYGFEFLGIFYSKSISLIIYWLFLAGFVDLMANIFKVKGTFQRILTLLSFSFLPWIFFAPLKLLKNLSDYTAGFAVILLLGVWIWTIILQVLAISEAYEIPRKSAIMVILLPFIGTILYFSWVVDFFAKIFKIAGL